MKHHFLRRLGALALAFALSLSLTVVPAWAVDGDTPTTGLTVSVNGTVVSPTAGKSVVEMTVGQTVELRVGPTDSSVDTTGCTFNWTDIPTSDGVVDRIKADYGADRVEITANKAGEIDLTVVMSRPGDDMDDLGAWITIRISEPAPPLTGITLSETTLEMESGGIAILNANPVPAGAALGEVTWSSSSPTYAAVNQNGVVTAVRATPEGSPVIITAKAKNKNGEDVTADCRVTVLEKPVYATGISFSPNTIRIDPSDSSGSKRVTAITAPSDTCNQVVEWDTTKTDKSVITLESVVAGNTYNRSVLLRKVGPGETTVTARVKSGENDYKTAVLTVTVTGITIPNPPGALEEKQRYQLQYAAFGLASTSQGTVRWDSDDPTTVSVDPSSGYITAQKVGTATITVTKTVSANTIYTDSCKVTVKEDTSSIVSMRDSYNAGKPLVMGSEQELATVNGILCSLPSALNNMSRAKTEVRDADGRVVTPASDLSYITNVSVPTAQGTLYYNYNSEPNTGAGVGITDRFYPGSAPVGQATLSQLTFVPRQGFSGTAEISFNGFAQNGTNFSGKIRVTVNGSGDGSSIYYGAISGQPTAFQAEDFNNYCRARTGQNLNYVTFTLPAASTGILYYNYTGPSQYSNRVSTNTQYSRTGNTNISNISFVPGQGYVGTVSISFRGVNTAGTSFTGTVVVTVGASSTGMDSADVSFTAQDGKQAALRADVFNDACRGVLGENLAYVRFKLPAASEGTLYYNYSGDSSKGRVDETTRYYYSGTPGISNITFVAAANAGGQVAVPYTGYSASGATYTGTMYINLQSEDQQTIRYFVDKGGLVSLQVNDFNNVCLRQTGYTMDYVTFQSLPSSAMGTLYYNYRSNISYNTRVWTGTSYYRSYDSRYPSRYLLSNISFLAGNSAGTVTIPYTAYASTPSGVGSRWVSGTVVIQVGAPSPVDVNLSGTTASPVWLSSYTIRNVCTAVMDNDLSYIEITSVPDEKEGRVYSNYNGYGTGTEVKTGTRYYRMGSPSIDQLSFVPYGGFKGTATITYIGYSSNGREQVSGQIKIAIANSTTSRYFNDMSRHTWAADAVDFLYVNNISEGVGNGRYSPGGTLTRGDFTLMVVRTFGFTSDSIRRYDDVPASSYYARAISTAKALGITVGDSGSNFYPKRAITRQDAMVMLYNALKVSGKTMTNGLAADMSKFSDRGSIAGYAAEAVGSLVQMGVVKGDGNGRLRPTGTLTRAETAILLQYVLTL